MVVVCLIMMMCVMDDVVCSQVHSLLVERKEMTLAVILLPCLLAEILGGCNGAHQSNYLLDMLPAHLE